MSEENGSLLDSIGATLSETYAKVNTDEATAQVDTSASDSSNDGAHETEAEKAERLRDERGRFAANAQDGATEGADPAAIAQDDIPVSKAPGTWPKELRDTFATLPQQVQDFVTKREGDFSRTLNNYTQKAKFADSISNALSPYAGTMQADGLNPEGVISGLMQTYHVLRNAAPHQKAQAIAQLAHQFGVDMTLAGQEDGNAGNSPAYDAALYEKVSRMEQFLLHSQQTAAQNEQQQIDSQIADFSKTAPHFEAVRAHMGALLQSGLAKDLADAYEQATMAHPEIRATLLREQEAKRREEAAKQAAAARKSAAVNIAQRGIQTPARPTGTMEDTMRDTLRRLQNS